MWDDFLVFYDSFRKFHDYPIYIIALEMPSRLVAKLRSFEKVIVIDLPKEETDKYKKVHAHWRQWYKPFYFDMIPQHETILWLDIDMVIIADLEPIFQHIERQFVVMADYFAPKTCRNNPALYEKYGPEVPIPHRDTVLNSGVVGYKPTRDYQILELWKAKVTTAINDPEVRNWIALFDQGALLWALQELQLYDVILAKREWNYPAKKNPYELNTPSKPDEDAFPPWPTSLSMEGNVIHQIKVDNPRAVIAHFAGLPKLAHLCVRDHVSSQNFAIQKHGGTGIQRTFVIGLERCGIRAIAEIARRSCTVENWIRVNFVPTLAAEVQAKHSGRAYETHALHERIACFRRRDCNLVMEANKNLGFFIEEIFHGLSGECRFILMLRDPVQLLKSHILNFCTWNDTLYLTPDYYQRDYRKYMALGLDGSNNYFRIRPPENQIDMNDLVGLHLWEIESSLQTIMTSLKQIPTQNWKVCWLDSLSKEILNLSRFMAGFRLDLNVAREHARIRYGANLEICGPDTVKWVTDVVNERSVEIYSRWGIILNQFGVSIPYCGI
jgi:hypothetical protein